jgi:hypothetical protein
MKSSDWAVLLLAVFLPLAYPDARAAESGTIRGRFLLHGELSKSAPRVVDINVAVCGKCEIPNEQLVVGADRGLANVLVYIRSKNVPLPPRHEPGRTVINIDGCRFNPHVAIVEVGQELIIRNNDPVGHNEHVATMQNPASGTIIPAGGEKVQSFRRPELVPFRVTCNFHHWMEAWVLVRPNPYACVSAETGVFEIANVPYGTWELQFWHEKLGPLREMSISGEVQPVPKGRMDVSVDRDMMDFGDIALDFTTLMGGKAEPGVGADSR